MKVETLAYLAGVLDMHAVIRTRKGADGDLPSIAMHGPQTDMLEFLANLTGTRAIVTRRDYTKAGCAEHCAEKHQHIVSVSGRWSVTGAKATVLLWNVRPYMRLQTDVATAAIGSGLRAGYKPATLKNMRDLGWDLPDFGKDPS